MDLERLYRDYGELAIRIEALSAKLNETKRLIAIELNSPKRKNDSETA